MAEKEEKKVTEAEAPKKEAKAEVKKAAPKKGTAKAVKTSKSSKKEEANKPLRTEAKAELINYGVTPRKVRLVVDLVRGKDLDTAYAILDNCAKLCAIDIKKLIQSAEANAVNNFHMDQNTLYVAEITANDATRLKRILPRAKGSASGLIKRWSHVFVTLKNREAK